MGFLETYWRELTATAFGIACMVLVMKAASL